jgi:23S rRNA (adenine2503-C2)-methyltransferase
VRLPVWSNKSRSRPDHPLLWSLPSRALEDLLVRSGGSQTQARATAAKVVGYVSSHGLEPSWDEHALRALGVGAWAHETLLSLDASVSLTIAERAPSADGTERLLFRARDSQLLETVIIPGPARTTVCISSQIGCARACSFCETGRLGLVRQLDAGEIVDQVRIALALWGSKDPPIQNVVFMGMGEPLDNLQEVARATWVLTDDRGLALSRSRVTVSTVGVADKIEAFVRTCRAELAVSINAPDDERRAAIMPVSRRFPLAALMAEIEKHVPKTRKVLVEYVLFGGFNDAEADADLLAELVRPIRCLVNVIPANPGPDPALVAPSPEAVGRFVERLARLGVTTLVRRARGRDVGGACGQLAGARRGSITSAGGADAC